MKPKYFAGILASLLVTGCGGEKANENNEEGIRISYGRLTELSNLAYSGINEAQVIKMNSQAELDTTWANYTASMQPKPIKPSVNFSEHTLIAFFAGAQASPCHKLVIDSIRDAGFQTRIYFHTAAPSPTADCAQVIVYPHEWLVINKTSDTITAVNQTQNH